MTSSVLRSFSKCQGLFLFHAWSIYQPTFGDTNYVMFGDIEAF